MTAYDEPRTPREVWGDHATLMGRIDIHSSDLLEALVGLTRAAFDAGVPGIITTEAIMVLRQVLAERTDAVLAGEEHPIP